MLKVVFNHFFLKKRERERDMMVSSLSIDLSLLIL